ncbi:MAG: hypothetical protein AAB019_12100 [Planctomycetota bacterium]
MGKNKKFVLICVLIFLSAAGLTGRANQETGEPSETLDEIMNRVQEFQEAVEQIRGKKFKTDVTVKIQSTEDFTKFVKQAIDKYLPDEVAIPYQTALIKLGLLPKDYNLRQGYEDLYTSQAGAYYDPATKTFYLLKTKLSPESMNAIFVHELTHALQDQYFDLDSLTKKIEASDNDDQAMALRYLVEGEATYVMTIYSLQSLVGDSPEMLQQALTMQLLMSRESCLAATKLSLEMTGEADEETKKSTAILEKAPFYLFWVLHAPYLHGAYSVHQIVKKNDWAGVDKIFTEIPTTTEQIIHPDKLAPNRDEPTPCPLPSALGGDESWSIAYQNTLGEFGFWTLCEKFETESVNSKVAAKGWDGDRYFLLKNKNNGHYALGLMTAWDSEADARQSFKAYGEILEEKYQPEADWTSVKNDNSLTLSRSTTAGNFTTVLILKDKFWVSLEDFPQDEIENIKNAVLKNLEPGPK